MTGIKETAEFVNLVVAIAGVIKGAGADGKVDTNDLALLIQVFPHLGSAVDGIGEIPKELADLDETEIKEIADKVEALVGDLAGEKYQEVADHAIKAAFEIYEIVKVLKS